MNKPQIVLVLALTVGCVAGWGTTLWLITQKVRLEMELDTFVRLAARAKATEASLRGTPYFLRATNDSSASISTIVTTNNGIPVRLYPTISASDALFVQVFNEKTSELIER
jgi:hypothetical protein